ncbi:MAG: type II toxin-antitoxin system RelE/ParE family toxin [Candidatus Atribacteria bacterium]|nr:type II toxin-antitoxin system RelE/ParE family toxin [Candidatus Atribacteria bacterium]
MPLKGNFKGFFRYRIGKFRVIYTIQENHLLILVLKVGKRDEVYDE